VIVLSQNYAKDPELLPLVVQKNALPAPKDDTATGHQAIGGAIAYVLRHGTHTGIKESHPNRTRIFLVHGYDTGLLNEVARFLEKIKQTPLILREQPNAGKTIIEKFADYADVGYAIILLTPDDRGGEYSCPLDKLQPRARQNVLFELGYFIGKLGRDRVTALHVPGVEIPSDYSGVLFICKDNGRAWQFELAGELRDRGFQVDMNLAV
jgi:predicted nucleotide-binding protein